MLNEAFDKLHRSTTTAFEAWVAALTDSRRSLLNSEIGAELDRLSSEINDLNTIFDKVSHRQISDLKVTAKETRVKAKRNAPRH